MLTALATTGTVKRLKLTVYLPIERVTPKLGPQIGCATAYISRG